MIHTRDRLILALDVPTAHEARRLVDALGDTVSFFKIGLQLFLSGAYFELVDWLRARDKKIFADLKLYDVPRTVGAAVRQLRAGGVEFITVHGDAAILRAACEAGTGGATGPGGPKGGPGILAVTVLTCIASDNTDLGFADEISTVALDRAQRAARMGCAGVVTSGWEAGAVRAVVPGTFRIVVPGIRDSADSGTDDQKRTVTVEQAFEAGADYIVVGRPIHGHPDPAHAAAAIQDRIAAHFGNRS